MKNNILSLIVMLVAAIGFVSCDDTWKPQVDKEGQLMLSSLDISVNDAVNLQSRASNFNVDVNTFVVEILDKNKNVVNQWTYAKMPEIITLPVGDYTANVYSHKVEKQAWESPYFCGEKAFSISANKISEIGSVVCKFASLKVTIEFDKDLLKRLSEDTKVTVVANDEGLLEYSINETRAGYFEVLNESNTLVATLEGKIDGASITPAIVRTYTNVAPGTHYHIAYSIKDGPEIPEETGSVEENGISVNTSVEDVNVGGNIDIEDETGIDPGDRPGTEDPVEPEDPEVPSEDEITYNSATLSFDKVNLLPSDELEASSIVIIKAQNGIKSLCVHIESDSEAFNSSASEMVPFDFDLADPVVDGKDWSGGLGADGLGFPVKDQVVDQTEVEFNITQFVPLLAGFSGNHAFTITTTDNAGNSKSATLKFKAE